MVTVDELGAFQFNCTVYCVAGCVFGSTWSASVSDTPLEVAVIVTFCVVVTDNAVATKLAVVELAGTVTVAGTWSALLLLESDTFTELVAAALRDTEHAVVVGPSNVSVAQESLLRLTTTTVVSGYNVIASVLVTPSATPVIVTLVVLLTAVETASKLPDADPAAIVTVDGTWRAELLLDSATLVALLADPFKDTVQLFD